MDIYKYRLCMYTCTCVCAYGEIRYFSQRRRNFKACFIAFKSSIFRPSVYLFLSFLSHFHPSFLSLSLMVSWDTRRWDVISQHGFYQRGSVKTKHCIAISLCLKSGGREPNVYLFCLFFFELEKKMKRLYTCVYNKLFFFIAPCNVC